ncbi:hypothetical protein Mmc1_0024 [Magnetococcus marinus MC-1]|uniref:Uncharacterized protein n=1 Tax=Magnetococcus marinus (strain ATCC BAA-1437 / JCM 17883 / MC-1) TaxID=156889 RepID=A0L3L0_MAGMM|nr:hypothetical protein [Magnetococcus marinus]ABK42553.1 hypothetical protein Mmc1_0024 [Magnetococcus marinus MC-1]
MTMPRDMFRIDPDPNIQRVLEADSYWQAREKILDTLIKHTLIDSYNKFRKAREPYPFISRSSLRPGSVVSSKEYKLHNSALVVLLADVMPASLRKHFRCRLANRVIKKNIAGVAPDLPGLNEYDTAWRDVHHEGFIKLMRMMLPLDFALLVQPSDEDDRYQLTNFHVKIERLLDMALRTMGHHLNYLERGLYEQGETFIDQLERKFFEYFNYYHNAAGRRGASALAAQVLAMEQQEATIFSTSQQDRRLTLLTTYNDSHDLKIEQYVLLSLEPDEYKTLKQWGKDVALDIRNHYLIHPQKSTQPVVVMRLVYQHTEAAQPNADGTLRELNVRERWIRLTEETIIPLHGGAQAFIGYPVAYKKDTAEVDGKSCPLPVK